MFSFEKTVKVLAFNVLPIYFSLSCTKRYSNKKTLMIEKSSHCKQTNSVSLVVCNRMLTTKEALLAP